MLQIISGKFFGPGAVNERESDAVLYSNFSWIEPIRTKVAELRPCGGPGTRVSSFVLHYKVRYEPAPNDALVLPVGEQAVDQFRLLAGLWFQSFFHADRYHVEMLCRDNPRQSSDSSVPCHFVDSCFDGRSMANPESVQGFITFIDKVIGMRRKTFRLFMSCLSAYFNALEAIDANLDLAYSMFVYALEGLTQGADNFTPTWGDYPEQARVALEHEFAAIDPERVESIRSILLNHQHMRLMKRFVSFTHDHVSNSFFRSEATHRRPAIQKNELRRALENLYRARSGYVHELRQIQELVRFPAWGRDADVLHCDNEPHLTFSGLARLCRHVLLRFAKRQVVCESENYPNWRDEVPGLLHVPLAPQYWVAKVANFRPESAKSRFSGFIRHLAGGLKKSPPEVLDVRELIGKMEKSIPQAIAQDRKVLLTFCNLFRCLAPEEDHPRNWQQLVQNHKADLEECASYTMACLALVGGGFDWPVEECERAFEKYLTHKFRKRAVNLPSIIETAVMAEIANLHLEVGNVQSYRDWIGRAILDSAGQEELQKYLEKCREEECQLCTRTILGIPSGAIMHEPLPGTQEGDCGVAREASRMASDSMDSGAATEECHAVLSDKTTCTDEQEECQGHDSVTQIGSLVPEERPDPVKKQDNRGDIGRERGADQGNSGSDGTTGKTEPK